MSDGPGANPIRRSAPTLSEALNHFLARSRFSARTRESYSLDLAPLLGRLGNSAVSSLDRTASAEYLSASEGLAASTYNRRYASLASFARWCIKQGWLDSNPLLSIDRRKQARGGVRALDPEQVEAVLRSIRGLRDRALFWLIYEGGLRASEALAIDIDNIDWTERAIRIQGKGDRPREAFFSRRVSRYLDGYLKSRGEPSTGALFVTRRKARSPRRADLTAEGYARLSYRQADTLWKGYAPGWDLHQLRHTAISARAAQGYTEVELKRFSGHQSLRSLEVYIADNREDDRIDSGRSYGHPEPWCERPGYALCRDDVGGTQGRTTSDSADIPWLKQGPRPISLGTRASESGWSVIFESWRGGGQTDANRQFRSAVTAGGARVHSRVRRGTQRET